MGDLVSLIVMGVLGVYNAPGKLDHEVGVIKV